MSALLQSVVDAAPFSWIAAAGVGLALVSCLVAFRLRAERATSRGARTVPIVCGLALLTATGAAAVGVEIGRAEVAAQLVARDTPAMASDIARGISRQLACLTLLGPIALVALLSAGLLRWRLRNEPDARPSRAAVALGAAVVLPLLVSALGASIYGLRVHAGYVAIADVDPTSKESAMLERLQRAYHLLPLMRACIVGLAGAGLIAAIAWARSAGLGRAAALPRRWRAPCSLPAWERSS